jgi:membrane protease YdiL (CAAX protease family)
LSWRVTLFWASAVAAISFAAWSLALAFSYEEREPVVRIIAGAEVVLGEAYAAETLHPLVRRISLVEIPTYDDALLASINLLEAAEDDEQGCGRLVATVLAAERSRRVEKSPSSADVQACVSQQDSWLVALAMAHGLEASGAPDGAKQLRRAMRLRYRTPVSRIATTASASVVIMLSGIAVWIWHCGGARSAAKTSVVLPPALALGIFVRAAAVELAPGAAATVLVWTLPSPLTAWLLATAGTVGSAAAVMMSLWLGGRLLAPPPHHTAESARRYLRALRDFPLWSSVGVLGVAQLGAFAIVAIRAAWGVDWAESAIAAAAAEARTTGMVLPRGTTLMDIVASSASEELLFRWLLFGMFRSLMGTWPAATLSALIFAASHIGYSVGELLVPMWFGMVAAIGYSRVGRIAPLFIAHVLFDLLHWR